MDKVSIQYDAIRKRIFDLLNEQKITQKEFAEKLQIPAQTITDWKKGKSNSFTGKYNEIALILQTTPTWLAFGDGIKYLPEKQRAEILNPINDGAELRLIRSALSYTIDHIPDDKLNRQMIPLIELLAKMSSEDCSLLEGIMRVMINRREQSSDGK